VNVFIVGDNERSVDLGVKNALLNKSSIVSQKISPMIVDNRQIPAISHFKSQEIRLSNNPALEILKGA
jgi:hypothetical protein